MFSPSIHETFGEDRIADFPAIYILISVYLSTVQAVPIFTKMNNIIFFPTKGTQTQMLVFSLWNKSQVAMDILSDG